MVSPRANGLRARRDRRAARVPHVPRAQPCRPHRPRKVLGYEATYVGTGRVHAPRRNAQRRRRRAGDRAGDLHRHRRRAGSWRRRPPGRMPAREFATTRRTRRRARPSGQIVSIYGDGLTAGQNQIVALNKGGAMARTRGVRRWRCGAPASDDRPTDPRARPSSCPTSATACCSCSAFERMSHALILSVQNLGLGDRFTQP